MTLDLVGDQGVVAVQRPRPRIVAERGGALRRRNDVGEQHRRQSAIRRRHGTNVGVMDERLRATPVQSR